MHNSPLMFNHFTNLQTLQSSASNNQTGSMTPSLLNCYPNISPNISANGTSSPSNLFSLFQSPLATPRVTPTQSMPYLYGIPNDCEHFPNIFSFHQQNTMLNNTEKPSTSSTFTSVMDHATVAAAVSTFINEQTNQTINSLSNLANTTYSSSEPPIHTTTQHATAVTSQTI
jgi:hypothetical protein